MSDFKLAFVTGCVSTGMMVAIGAAACGATDPFLWGLVTATFCAIGGIACVLFSMDVQS